VFLPEHNFSIVDMSTPEYFSRLACVPQYSFIILSVLKCH